MVSSVIEAYKTQKNMDKCGVGWFKFDESSGNVTDSKGSAIGTVTGATRVVGVSGSALNFNGSSYVQFNQKVIPVGKKSIRFKYKRNGKPTSGTWELLLDNSNWGQTSNGLSCYVVGSTGFIAFDLNKGTSGSNVFGITSNFNICDNQWHDILLTWDGTTDANSVKLFVDDMVNPKAVKTATQKEVNAPTYNLIIGKRNNFNQQYTIGQIDELEIYNDVIDLTVDKLLICRDTEYLYFGQNPTTLENEWVSLGESPTDEDWLNKGVDVVTQEQLERLSQQEIVGRFAVKRL